MSRLDKLNIAFITKGFLSEDYFYGGLENYVFRVSKKLSSLGHEVHVITCSDEDESEFEYHGLKVHRLKITPLPGWLKWLGRESAEGSTGQRLYFNLQVYRILKKIHQKTPLDIVQYTNVYASGLLSGLLLPVPYVVRASSDRFFWDKLEKRKNDFDHRLYGWLEWLQLRLSRHVYTPSYRLKKILAQNMKIKNVFVIRSPAYLEVIDWDYACYEKFLKGKEYLLFFGRFQIRKGLHVLAQALPRFFKENPEAYLVCVGPDYKTSLAPSMKEYARLQCLDYPDRLIFMEPKRHRELYPIIAGAKVVVLPSLIENLPNACIEAMLLAKPVVGTQDASFEELITDGENGFLARPDDMESLTGKINEAWHHPNLDKIGVAAREKIKELASEKTIGELLEYFKKVIAASRRQH